jgi:hypothetical protein
MTQLAESRTSVVKHPPERGTQYVVYGGACCTTCCCCCCCCAYVVGGVVGAVVAGTLSSSPHQPVAVNRLYWSGVSIVAAGATISLALLGPLAPVIVLGLFPIVQLLGALVAYFMAASKDPIERKEINRRLLLINGGTLAGTFVGGIVTWLMVSGS